MLNKCTMQACLTKIAEDLPERCSKRGVGRFVGGLKGSAVPRNAVHCCTGPALVKGDLQSPQRMKVLQVPDKGIMAVISGKAARSKNISFLMSVAHAELLFAPGGE